MNEQVHPRFKAILQCHFPQPRNEMTEADKQNALRLALDPEEIMPSWLRTQIIGKYGTAQDFVKFAEQLAN